ncbi:hypothetical protein C1N81_05690 (plasmid) [Streptomyces sp. SGAir0957]
MPCRSRHDLDDRALLHGVAVARVRTRAPRRAIGHRQVRSDLHGNTGCPSLSEGDAAVRELLGRAWLPM